MLEGVALSFPKRLLSSLMNSRDAITFSEMLWPDKVRGPWYVRAWWAHVDRDQPEPVGVWLWHGAAPDPADATGHAFIPLPGGPRPVVATAVRDLPMGTILAALRKDAAERMDHNRAIVAAADLPAELEYVRADLLGDRPFTVERGARGRPPTYNADHWAQVAAVYRAARRDPTNRAETQTVAGHFTVSRSTAAKWVAKCRALGLLRPTERGRAGERLATTDDKET